MKKLTSILFSTLMPFSVMGTVDSTLGYQVPSKNAKIALQLTANIDHFVNENSDPCGNIRELLVKTIAKEQTNIPLRLYQQADIQHQDKHITYPESILLYHTTLKKLKSHCNKIKTSREASTL